jgi:membrane peptidoglycan carboxypeptidase
MMPKHPSVSASFWRRTALHSREAVLQFLHRLIALPATGLIPELVRLSTVGCTPLYRRGVPRWMRISLLAGLCLASAAYEVRTSTLQSMLFSWWAGRLTYALEPGPSPRIAFPEAGPFDQRLGYTRIPEFARRLQEHGYRVSAQVRFSDAAQRLVSWGLPLPYQEPPVAGLVIRDRDGAPLYDSTLGHGVFHDIAEVPHLLVDTVLFVENRSLQEPPDPRQNPVIDWARLGKAAALYAGRKLGLPLPLEGASTLSTQLEKFQHSRGGHTASALDKLRQMASASLKAYRDGVDTRPGRREILLRYLNEVPLAAAPGWGEVNGITDGLIAWFGDRPAEVLSALASPTLTPEKVRAYKHVLALLCAVRAPTTYLVRNRAALEARVALYTELLQKAGLIDSDLAHRLRLTSIAYLRERASPPARLVLQRKAVSHLRAGLGQFIGEPNLYDLDRLHLEVGSTLDLGLQQAVGRLFDQVRDRDFLARHGLLGDHLLGAGDPRDVLYSFLLLERTPQGNLVRVHTDTLDMPFDVNDGMKMELGSTAKLRTLAHYLELMTGLHGELSGLDADVLGSRARSASDPLTRWAAETLRSQRGLALEAFLRQALSRTYSASPREVFFTGGGVQTFANYEHSEDGRVYSVQDGLIHSVNLVYIRLMRDLVRFHEARLHYDAQAVLSDPDDPVRRGLLEDIAATEAREALARAYREYRGLSPQGIESHLLGRQLKDLRHQSMLFFAWHPGAGEEALGRWLDSRVGSVPPDELGRLMKSYGNPRLGLMDFAFLMGRRPLDVWAAGELTRTAKISLDDLRFRCGETCRAAAAWLFRTRNRHAQDVRLRIRIEQDAFARMTPSWRRLGFPFDRLVPSLATAIGSSSDRPDALAELMGIILNDGMRLPTIDVRELRFASGTPYETVLEHATASGERAMPAVVARALRPGLLGVVSEGTAQRAAGAFVDAAGTITELGGKTGSGDNQQKTFHRGGGVISSRPVSRTAAFAFFIGDRYFGVITASVAGRAAGKYEFTSSLPVALLGMLAPAIESRLPPTSRGREGTPPGLEPW